MRILIADDNDVSRALLEETLLGWGHEVVVTRDGAGALQELRRPGAPSLAILDWMMPEIDGLEVCRRVRQEPERRALHILLLTGRDQTEDLIAGLDAGADDYVTKPFDQGELKARLQVGIRLVELQEALAHRVIDLETALSNIKQLRGLLPICSYCKKIRDDKNYWRQVESYVGEYTEAEFSHSICPDCYRTVVKPELEKLGGRRPPQGRD